jgi:hypothetical protein
MPLEKKSRGNGSISLLAAADMDQNPETNPLRRFFESISPEPEHLSSDTAAPFPGLFCARHQGGR